MEREAAETARRQEAAAQRREQAAERAAQKRADAEARRHEREIDATIRTAGRVATSRAGQSVIRKILGTFFGGSKG